MLLQEPTRSWLLVPELEPLLLAQELLASVPPRLLELPAF